MVTDQQSFRNTVALAHEIILMVTGILGLATSYLGYQMVRMNRKLNGHIQKHKEDADK